MTEESLSAEPTIIQKVAAEVIGTFILVFIGCGSVVALWAGEVAASGVVDRVATALAFGIAVVMGAYAFGRVSGGHFNPAVTLGTVLAGRKSVKEAGIYIGSQFAGAVLASIVLFVIAIARGYNSFNDGGLAANGLGEGAGTIIAGALIEIVLTFIFVFIILAITDGRAASAAALAPLGIGLALTAIHIVGIPLTGTSVNPARTFGPALFSGGEALWQGLILIVVTAIGGILAGLLYPLIFGKDGSEVEGGFSLGGGGAAQSQGFQWDSQAAAAPAAPAAAAPAPPAAPAAPEAPTAPAPTPETSDRTIVSGGGGGQQTWQQPTQTAEGDLPVYEQDGWRWDYAKQEWVPIEQ